jgi:hypothetical protein
MNTNTIDTISFIGGMAYSLKDEPLIMYNIVKNKFDVNMMAKYADIVCRKNALNISFLAKQLDNKESSKYEYALDNLNPTSFGNLAYLSINSPNPYNKLAFNELNRMINAYNNYNVK